MPPAPVTITGLATALPSHSISSQQTADQLSRMCARDIREAARVHAAVRLSEVESRFSVLADGEGELTFYAPEVPPSTADRMAVYRREITPLAQKTAERSFALSPITPLEITHLVTASCTGFYSPGFDAELIPALGLSPTIPRSHVGFMGCHGAFNAWRIAQAFAASDGAARVLVVCAELCSLHLQRSLHRDALVPNTLFSDGAGSMIVGGHQTPEPHLQLESTASQIFPDSADAMTWTIGNTGFEMTLSPHVPEMIAAGLRPWVESTLARHNIRLRDVTGWAIHPGGPKILDAAGKCLGLRDEDLAPSRHILRTQGNMSSATIFFVLQEWLASHSTTSDPVVALAFGPGLTAELALFVANS